MSTGNAADRRSSANAGYPSIRGGVWYPLGGQLEGAESAWIMFHGPRGSGETHERCKERFHALLKRYGIELKDDLLMPKDFQRFREAMAREEWSNEFIAFGP